LKILYVQPGLGVGGSKISLSQILKTTPLEQTSHVALAAPPDEKYEQMIGEYAEKIHYLDLPTWQKYRRNTVEEKLRAPLSSVKRLLSLFPSVRMLAQIIKKEKIDLVHTNNSICPVGAIASWFCGIPHIWHIREPIGNQGQYPLILGDRFSAVLFNRLSKAIICNSEYTAQFFREFGYPVKVIQNGLDIDSFQDASLEVKALRSQLMGDADGPVIAMIGSLTTQWKGHSTFLDLAARIIKFMPACRFVVFGSSSNLNQTLYTRGLEKQIENLRLGDRLVLADFISDVPAMLQSMDILVHPAVTEGSGRVVMEAMAAGKPVVSFKAGGVQELIQNGITGFLVEPDDIHTLVEKVKFLLENPQNLYEMGLQARDYAKAHFSNQKTTIMIADLYQKVLNS
jgi:glycosyltransferase involved in cell wall biosynthesis